MTKNTSSPTISGGLLATILITTAFIVYHFWGIFLNFGTTKCLEPYRDGIKTNLNAIYHAKYDNSLTLFGGMNYPYKEHIVAATELPGVAILLKILHPVFPGLVNYTFSISYLVLLFSILLAAVFMYLIFRTLRMPNWFAVPVAVGLTFLAPQNMRFGAHMGLAPLFVIPAIIYGLLLFERKPRIWVSSFIGVVVIIASLLHFYFFAITVFTISFYLLFSLLLNFSWNRLVQIVIHYILMVGVPLGIFAFWMILNDPVKDRSPKPYGFLVYNARWESIFASNQLPLYRYIHDNIIKIETTDFEGWSYVGMVAGLFTLVYLLKLIWHPIRLSLYKLRGSIPKRPVVFGIFSDREKQFYMPLLLTGVVMFFWSCSEPFATPGFEFLLQYAGPLRQFRSTGRFAWIFYFIINILAFVSFYKIMVQWKWKPLRVLGFLFIFGILFYESYLFINRKIIYAEENLHQVPELLPGQRFTDIPGIDYSKYQAILPLPYYNVGSNNFGAQGGAYSIQKSLVLSTQTGLPVTGAMLTRSSRQQSFHQLQMVSEPYREPIVFDDYPNNKPLLLFYSKQITEEEKAKGAHLLQFSKLLHENKDWSLWEMELDAFRLRIADRKFQVKQAMEADTLHAIGKFLSSDTLENFVLESFDNQRVAKSCIGPGAFEGVCKDTNTVFSGPLPNPEAWANYHLLAWVFANDDRFTATGIRIKETDENGNVLQESTYGVSFQDKVYDPRGWVLIDCPFQLKSDKSKLTVTFRLDEGDDRKIWIDEVLIKKVKTNLYRSEGKGVWWNNRWYE